MFKSPRASFSLLRRSAGPGAILGILLTLAGCNGGMASEADPRPSSAAVRPPETRSVTLPDATRLRDEGLALPVGEERIRIGELESEAAAKVPKERGGLELNDPVPVVGADLRTRGWSHERRAFALATQESRVVLAMDQRRSVDAAEVQATLAALETANGAADEFLGGVYTNYRFWDRGRVRLMMVDSADATGRRAMTVVLGDSSLMNGLRMALDDARADQARAARMLDRVLRR